MGRWSHSGLQSQHLFQWLQMLALLSSQEGAQTSGPYLPLSLEKGFLVHQYVHWDNRPRSFQKLPCFPSLQVRARITDAHHHIWLYMCPENPNSGPHAWEPSPIQLTYICDCGVVGTPGSLEIQRSVNKPTYTMCVSTAKASQLCEMRIIIS